MINQGSDIRFSYTHLNDEFTAADTYDKEERHLDIEKEEHTMQQILMEEKCIGGEVPEGVELISNQCYVPTKIDTAFGVFNSWETLHLQLRVSQLHKVARSGEQSYSMTRFSQCNTHITLPVYSTKSVLQTWAHAPSPARSK